TTLFRSLGRSVDGIPCRGLVGILDDLKTVNARSHVRTAAGRAELYRDSALEFKRADWLAEAASSCIGAANRTEKARKTQRCPSDREVTGCLIPSRISGGARH